MRAALLILLGLAIGAIGTVFAMNALKDRNPMPHAVMTVMSHHFGQLRNAVKAQQCDAAKTQKQLGTLLAVSGDIGPAFAGVEQPFLDAADKLHSAIQSAAVAAPTDCQALAAAIKPVGEACESCHRQYH
ncbi:MAG TPA: cytochrome c [Dyella sp.]|uniref:cytochrome c n=1 Tax=Dyella sp. TaxID=1869338 RepID=UPI002F926E50